MSATESNSVDSLITSIIDNLKQVPLAAIPAVLDCILASTGVSPSSLFFSLLDFFPSLLKDIAEGDQKLDHCQSNHVLSIVFALCHVLKNLGTSHDAMKLFIWKCLIQFLKMVGVSDHGIFNQIAESFFDVVSTTRSWCILEATLVPFFLRSLGYSMLMVQNEKSDIFEWGQLSDSLDLDDLIIDFGLDKEFLLSLSSSFPFPVSCHILALILDDALENSHTSSIDGSMLENGCCGAEKLFGNLLWVLCNMSEILLLQSLEHRSCTISLLLPVLFKAFASHRSLKISVHGRKCILSRTTFLRKIWKCCRSLFSMGDSERRDAYCVLSLYMSFFHRTEGGVSDSCGVEEFDVKAEKEFWDEIKRGLVDEEGLTRKQSIHILKAVLHISGGSWCYPVVQEKKSQEKHPISHVITKSEIWANKEAQSLGVGKLCNPVNSPLNSQQQWEAFVLLYEMLEEYGTHLVEAAWNHQISLLLQFSLLHGSFASSICEAYQNPIEALGETFNWLTILWKRGFHHNNPQVRCFIMQSFLGIEWAKYGDCTSSVPECFVLGPFMEGLNDPVHHKDFGVKGIYTSRAIEGAVQFLHQYATNLNERKGIDFLVSLASVAKHQSFGRVGLMGLAECIAAAACGVGLYEGNEPERTEDALPNGAWMEPFPEHFPHNAKTFFLDALRFVVESSKQQFNPNYRLRVCEKVLEAATLVVSASDVPLENLLHFVDTLPHEFTNCGGSLRERTQAWVRGYGKECSSSSCYNVKSSILKELQDFPESFISSHVVTFDDEDLSAWESEANRWARLFFLAIKEDDQLKPLFTFFQSCGVNICRETTERSTVKFLILTMSLLVKINLLHYKAAESGIRMIPISETGFLEGVDGLGYAEASIFDQKFSEPFLLILDNLVSLANISSAVFWSGVGKETTLPNSVRGKLGGPSQRRLSSLTTTAVLQAITSMRAVSSVSSCCAPFKSDVQLTCGWAFMWEFFWKTVTSPTCDSETGAEILLAAYEALVPVLRALASSFSPLALDLLRKNQKILASTVEAKPCLDLLVLSFLQNINNLLEVGVLARTRRAVLLNWKWLCLESLLSIPYNALQNGLQLEAGSSFFSDSVIRDIFYDLVESLENAGEGTVLVMLRSVRLVLRLFDSGKCGTLVSSGNSVDAQMMWHLVHSCWILHVSCNKRRVACIAALLSSVLHASVFSDGSMHGNSSAPGPLKWFIENVLEEGTKSPRTIRLAALHLTGMWLSHPKEIKNYLKELKLLTLYGSVAFDEDFEAELVDNFDARKEVSLLAKSPDAELTEAFINTELYARVSVAVLFSKLADLANLVGSADENEDCFAALESGKLFLLDLLNSVVNDKDLAKELYKKYSGIHRRKIRAWQMICVLSRFVTEDILEHVTNSLHICLYRNNLPAVRQYLETFAINIYLKFPSLVREQLVSILRDYDMRPQALSSYVFIAANVILHASKTVQSNHLDELMPPIIPLLTSHHHSLRGFTQLLVYQVLCKFFPYVDYGASETMPIEKRCFEDLKSYMARNPDCKRLRASMEGFLDAYSPVLSSTPAGIFVKRVEDLEFECVPTSLMEEVLNFLNVVREDLRCSMAKDTVTIKNQSLQINEDPNNSGIFAGAQLPKEMLWDFQKKVTVAKHDKQLGDTGCHFKNNEMYSQLLEMEKEDELLEQSIHSRSLILERMRASRQDFILVASFLDRIPNLAGLARTCEVFKASGLVIADTSVLRDKQFQLISVTAEKWVPILEVPVNSVNNFLEKKKREGFSILGLEQTANSILLDEYVFPKKTVLVLGREKEGIPVDTIHILDACIEIPQLGVVRSLNVHVSGAIALWEYTRQQRSR